MKHIYLLLIGLMAINIYAQDGRERLSEKMKVAWDEMITNCNGENWNFKTVNDLTARTKSPYITIRSGNVHDPSENTAYSPIVILDLSSNNLKGDLPASLVKVNGKMNWPSTQDQAIILSHNELTSVPVGLGYTYSYFVTALRIDNNKLTKFHTKSHYDFSGYNISPYSGCQIVTMHQNEITSLRGSDLGEGFMKMSSIIGRNATEVRIDNNRLDFASLCDVVPFIKKQYSRKAVGFPDNSNCYFDYYPQKPLGNDVDVVNLDKNTNHELNFSLSHSQNVYRWMLNGKMLTLPKGTNLSFPVNEETAGVYNCVITNPELPEVTLYSKDMVVFMNKPGNKPINDFQIVHDAITSNYPEGAIVAEFTGADLDGDEVYYRLVEGAGNNSSFRIKNGKTLVSSEVIFEREYITEYKIVVEAYDIYGGTKQREFVITRGADSGTKLPEDITLSNAKVDENKADATIGILNAVGVTGYTFSLVNESDKAFFYIDGNSLKTKVGLDFESQQAYNIQIKASAADGTALKKYFEIEVKDLNDTPHKLIVTSNTILTDQAPATFIGILVGSDQDDENLTYSFIAGEGDTHNAEFAIDGNKLLSGRKFQDEDKGVKNIRILVKDDDNAMYEQILSINVLGELAENLPPRNIGLTNTVFWNDFELNDVVAHIVLNDPDGERGVFACNNEYLKVMGNTLVLIKKPNPGDKITVEIDGSDRENIITRAFTFYAEPTATDLKSIETNTVKVFPNPATDYLNFSALVDGYIYDLSGLQIKRFSQINKISVSDINPGTYLLKVKTEQGYLNMKFIKR